MKSSISVLCAFLLIISAVSAGCPTLSVSPCTCTDGVLECDRLTNVGDLKNVIQNSAGANYTMVRMTNSVMQYFPRGMFEKAEVQELHLIGGTFIRLFDEIPEHATSLKTLHIENYRILTDIQWRLFQHLTNLRTLEVIKSSLRYIGEDFARYTPASLQQITFSDTGVKIKQGVFHNLPNLDRLVIENARIKELQRNLLPVPFNGRLLYLKESNVKSLPADMFSDMPNLRQVSLFGNQLTTVPNSLFGTLEYLNLKENPINCDCDLAWITKYETLALLGECSTPLTLHGRDIRDAYNSITC